MAAGEQRGTDPTDASALKTRVSATEGLALHCLGTGRGDSATYGGQTSTAFLLTQQDSPQLLIDIGFGVTRACVARFGQLPDTIFVSHNHSDHAGELPVVLAVERARGRRLRLLCGAETLPRIRDHRLHELQSTGHALSHFCELVAVDDTAELAPGLTLQLRRGAHSECAYGMLLRSEGRPLLAYGADSAFDPAFYAWLFGAPQVIVNARGGGTAEHAGFEQVSRFWEDHPGVRVHVAGYGRAAQAPEDPPALRPGDCLKLAAG